LIVAGAAGRPIRFRHPRATPMASPVTRKVVFPSTLDAALRAQQQVLEEVAARRFDEDACFAIRLALDEAVANAIHHGNRNDASKRVIVEYTIDDDYVDVQVEDEGPGFAPGAVPDPTLPDNIQKPHGRGIMLIKAYMTEVRYNETGNRISMVKRRGCLLPVRAER
jgi:serine/threonine-protein kinase RsbW